MTTTNLMRILSPVACVGLGTSASASNHVIDASTEGVAWVFQAKSTEAITHVGFRYGARAATPPTYIAGIEGLSASTGLPDGTYKTNGGNCSVAFTPPANTSWDGIWQWIALDNAYTPTLGEVLCLSIRYSSGTIDATNNSSFTTNWSAINPALSSFPYAIRNTSGTWAVQNIFPVFGLRTASYRYGNLVQNLYATRSASTVGHRQAAKISIPAGLGDTFKLVGFRATCSPANAVGKSPIAKVWQGTTALTSKTIDTDIVGATVSGLYRTYEVIFDTAVTLNFGTDYYVGFEVADAVNAGVLIYGTQLASSDDNTEDGGGFVSFATFNGTSWTDDTTVRPWMELIVDDWTEPSGGGGLVAPIISSSGGLIIR